MRLQLSAISLLLAAKPIVSFNPADLFGIFRQQEPQIIVEPPETYEEFLARYADGCPVHKYGRVRIVSRKPEIMLIDGFVSEREAEALLNVAEPLFRQSTIAGAEDYYQEDTEWRSSSTAFLTQADDQPEFKVVRCIEERAAEFQGYIPLSYIEYLQVVRYYKSQQYREHHDWFYDGHEDLVRWGNRVSSFFVYLVANCTGGNTLFPNVTRPVEPEFCDTLKCTNEDGSPVKALEVKPIQGTAVFWYNLDPHGVGQLDTLHAGLPVGEGTKIGLNIWTRTKKMRSFWGEEE